MSTVHFLSQLDQHTLIEQIVVALIAYLRAGMFAMVPQFLSLKVFWHSYSDCVLEKWQEMKLEIFIKKKNNKKVFQIQIDSLEMFLFFFSITDANLKMNLSTHQYINSVHS